jgi:di/tricarboxylate transporter
MVAAKIAYAEVNLAEGSPLVGELVRHAGFRSRFNISVVGIYRRNNYRLTNLAYVPLRAGDRILVQGEIDDVEELDKFADFSDVKLLTDDELSDQYNTDERMFVVRLPKYSDLAEATLEKSRLADVFDFRVVAVFRDGKLKVMPRGDEVLEGGDLLLIEGQHEDLDVLRGMQELEVETKVAPNLGALESERLTLMDATLDPRSSLAGRTVGELNFRERYGIELAAIWREGGPIGADLAEERLQLGDALLLLGPRDRLQLLDSDSDFLILTPLGKEPPDTQRAPLAAFIMFAVVASVMAGYAPIAIAAVVGGSIMVLTGCLTMEQAYRAIDWRAIFLIAGMLPLGTAMQDTCRAICTNGDGYNDHPDRGARSPDVADRTFGDGRNGICARNRNDGHSNGRVSQLHQPYFPPCEHSRDGPGWIPVCGLHQSRRSVDDRGLHRGDDSAASSVAARTCFTLTNEPGAVTEPGQLNQSFFAPPDPYAHVPHPSTDIVDLR